MIRFSCPGCEAVFNVSDDKAGKTGKCPKCSSQFTIPAAAEGSGPAPAPVYAPPPPPPVAPPAGGGAAVEIAPCPKCGARLSVEAGDVGLDVECPTCRAVYPAEPAVAAKLRETGSGQKKSLVVADVEEDERPNRRRERSRDEDDEEERPSRRLRNEDEDDDDDDRPRKKKRRRSTVESKRVTAAILAWFLGIFGAHKFYLGYTNAGLIMLIGNFCTCYVFSIISFVEFIIYLTKSDDDFIETYQIGQKEWF